MKAVVAAFNQIRDYTSHRRYILYTVQHYFTPSNPQASAWCGQPSSTRTCWRTGCRWTPAPTSPSPPPGAPTGSSGGDPISTTMIAKNDGFRSYQMTNVRLVDDCWPVTGGKLICGFVVSVPSRSSGVTAVNGAHLNTALIVVICPSIQSHVTKMFNTREA